MPVERLSAMRGRGSVGRAIAQLLAVFDSPDAGPNPTALAAATVSTSPYRVDRPSIVQEGDVDPVVVVLTAVC